MSKIQGKQIADQTIIQRNLALETPDSGDTMSGATVGFVTEYITSISGSTVIGQAEDGTYEDGIFTDFTPSTPIGTAVDRFNEMFLLLAPSPPQSWEGALSALNVTQTKYSPRALSTGSSVSNMLNTTTPTPTVTSTVATGVNARVKDATIVLINDSSTLETVTIDSDTDTNKTTGRIRYNVGDPYDGISGQAGFWEGVTSLTLATSVPALTPGTNQYTMQLTYPSTTSPLTFNYYVDSPLTVTIGTISATMPSMSGNVSGVPTLATGQSITGIGFDINNVASYFYSATSVWQLNLGLVNGQTGDPDIIPTTNGETGSVTNESTTVRTGQFSDTSFSFTVRGRNSIGTYGGNTTYTNSAYRVDTVSNESGRITSGIGSYPSAWGDTYNSATSLLTSGNYENELQLRNGTYVYPTVDYTSVGGPNYSTATGTRYVTFNIGNFNDNSAFTLGITGSGINSIGQADLRIEIQISGQTFWVDGNANYAGVGDPGSTVDGTAAVVFGDSTATSRRITFGGITYTGPIIVRIGMTSGSNITITSLSAGSFA